MGKGGGSAPDTSGLERATREATRLQEDIYGQNVELAQPFYDVGVSSLGRLSDLLGIGGGSMRSREQVYQDLLPQYTTQGPGSGLVNVAGMTLGVDDLLNQELSANAIFGSPGQGRQSEQYRAFNVARERFLDEYDRTGNVEDALAISKAGSLVGPASGVTDFEALNMAVDQALGEEELPEDFGSFTERFSLEDFEEDPGYQFRKDEAQKALERSMAAQGVTLGGGGFGSINPQVARALEEQVQGLASQEYGAARDRYVQDQLNQYNMLAGLAGYGTAGLGSVTGSGTEYAANVGNLTTGLAQAQLQSDIAAASQPSMFEQLIPVAGQIGSAYVLSDSRLKENIKFVGIKNGHNIYEYNYKGKPGRHRGVIAQEVRDINPAAVQEVDGVLSVNYSMIGVEAEVL